VFYYRNLLIVNLKHQFVLQNYGIHNEQLICCYH
jgi:hypothetical protein